MKGWISRRSELEPCIRLILDLAGNDTTIIDMMAPERYTTGMIHDGNEMPIYE